MRERDRVHTVPRRRAEVAAARQPFPPSADDFVPEASRVFPVAGQVAVAAVVSDGVGVTLALIGQWQVPVALAPVEHELRGAGEPVLGRSLSSNIEALPRSIPHVGEAENVEGPWRAMPVQAGPPEVHEARPVQVQHEAEPARALGQHLQTALDTLPTRERDDKVIGESNQPAGARQTVLDRARTGRPAYGAGTGSKSTG